MPRIKSPKNTDDSVSDSDELYNLINGDILETFVNQLDVPYIRIVINSKTLILRTTDKKLSNYLRILYKDEFGKLPKQDIIKSVVDQLTAEAEMSGIMHPLELRINRYENSIYYDLVNDSNEVVKISPGKYEIVTDYPVILARNKNIVTQYPPLLNITDMSEYLLILKKHFRFKNENDLFLYGIYLVLCFVPAINHPILIIYGEHGSAKSSTVKATKKIVDPSKKELFSIPANKNDMAIGLFNSCMICYDNLQQLNQEKSDLLCIASTGGAISKRMLYSDADEVTLDIHRRVILNGISVAATQPDLLDRCILLELERIPETERKIEQRLWTEFEKDIPKLLGIIFCALSNAMALVSTTELPGYSRMADFTLWGYCVAEALGYEGQSFVDIYKENQRKANEEALFANPLAMSVIKFMENKQEYIGTVSDLYSEIVDIAMYEHLDTDDRLFPKAPHALSRRLNEIKSNLRGVGIGFNIRPIGIAKEIKIVKS